MTVRLTPERLFAQARPVLDHFEPPAAEAIWSELYPNDGLASRLAEWLEADADHPAALAEMLVPAALRKGQTIREVEASSIDKRRTQFHLLVNGEEFELKFDFKIYPAEARCPARLFVDEYKAKLPVTGGTLAFYQNLHFQLGHMDVPVVHGINAPDNIGYYLHRVGRVPVGMLDTQFEGVIDGIGRYNSHHRADFLRGSGGLSNTVSLNGLKPEQMLRPDFREPFQKLQTQFDNMTEEDRRVSYQGIMRSTFGIY